MQNYKDFTLNEETFDHFPEFVEEMKAQQIHLIPIIDAAVKVEKGYPVYDEGIEKDYFCKRADGSNFVAKVWPGETHFPDVLNPEARKWFGGWYKVLIDQGIEGFWNDMNEPSIFYSTEGMAEFREELQKFLNEEYDPSTPSEIFPLKGKMSSLSNSRKDFARFYHKVNGKSICHADVHNLYGYNMTRAAAEAFEQIAPGKRFLLFSRSSYIGMHRYGGIWTGDNKSWWSHLLLNLKMLPSLNMCGFLYSGADLGGFTENTTRDLLLRWLALGVFTPLMRNHSASEREQEFYEFEHPEDFRGVIETRYRLLPYIYSEYMKAVLTDDVYFKPMAFVYPKDELALRIEDQLMIGNEVMIAPVYTQNAVGRMVYLPERMLFVKFGKDGAISQELLEKGHHFVKVALHEVPLFIREGACIPVAKAAEWVSALDTEDLELIGFDGASYRLYDDDGETQNYRSIEECKVLEKK
jgi:alpha-glucosidase